MSSEFRVLVADDDPNVRAAVRLVIEREESFEIVGEAISFAFAVDSLELTQPDVILLDGDLPGVTPESLERLRAPGKPIAVVILVSSSSRPWLSGEVDGVVNKMDGPDSLRAALRRLASRGDDAAGSA